MRIAIIGSGVSGLVCARRLSRRHDVTLIEADSRLGGHAHTVNVRVRGAEIAVDTGFIVFNDRNYPNFSRLLDELEVPSVPTRMSFSVRCEATGLEWGGENLNALFAQRRNLLRPSFHRMIADILRFGDEAPAAAARLPASTTLGEFLERQQYSRQFAEHYLVPMGAAIWSMPRESMYAFPLGFFVRFFDNHGMLKPGTRPTWRTIPGGSIRYVEALSRQLRCAVRLNTAVAGVTRDPDGVRILTAGGAELFDHVIFATHSDTTLRILRDPTTAEREVLGAIHYHPNEAVLHTDASLLPRARRAWSAWNYRLSSDPESGARLTYCMNILQHIRTPASSPLCVTINDTAAIDPSKILGRWTYHHPQYTLSALSAQQRHAEISGVTRTHFCGAYWFNGFHEDGVRSALRVCDTLGESGTGGRYESSSSPGRIPVAL